MKSFVRSMKSQFIDNN